MNRNIFTDEETFELEMKSIFEGNWVYLAHESQVPERREMRAFVCRQFKKQDVLWASEIQGIRDFGSETAAQQVHSEVARKLGVTHIIRHTSPRGLARSFRDGADFALAHGADILVNTDGDNQYPQERIGDLVRPGPTRTNVNDCRIILVG